MLWAYQSVDLLISDVDLRSRAVGFLISAGRLGKQCYGYRVTDECWLTRQGQSVLLAYSSVLPTYEVVLLAY
jgi:hypothetical protein